MKSIKWLDKFQRFTEGLYSITDHYVPDSETNKIKTVINSLYDLTEDFTNVSICKHMGENEVEWVITLLDEDILYRRIDKYTITESGTFKVETNMNKKLWAREN